MGDVTITVRANGSYRVEGPVRLIDESGAEYEVTREVIALCRCGESSKKPFCDGTHRRIGFDACETAAELNARLATERG